MKPIIIAGFGRSGTTWLSDIISKTLGGLILFEPFHPCVYDQASDITYTTDPRLWIQARKHIQRCLSNTVSNPWLYRNHLNDPLDSVPASYINYLQEHTSCIGFKTIRINHLLSEACASLNANLVFIYRHPLAVLCSLEKRSRFWKEFGWDWHKDNFIRRIMRSTYWTEEQRRFIQQEWNGLHSREEYILMMWTLSFLLSKEQVRSSGGMMVCYEELYMFPFETGRKILNYLNEREQSIHPSYLFTPSMTTLSTVHSSTDRGDMDKAFIDRIFWSSSLSKTSAENYLEKIEKWSGLDESVSALLRKKQYLST